MQDSSFITENKNNTDDTQKNRTSCQEDSFTVYILEKDRFLEKSEQTAKNLKLESYQVALIKNY